VTLAGEWQAPHHADQVMGSALFATGGRGNDDRESTALIELAPSSAVRGITIFYPEQDIADVKPYPFSIRGRGMNGSVMDVTLVNSYRGIDFGTHANELHYIRNVFGCVLREGIYIDKCTDIGRIENVHFNPHFWFRLKVPEGSKPAGGDAVIDYMMKHLDAFVFGRTDWEYVLNTFCFGFKTCYKYIQTPAGACNGNFLGIGADAGQYSIWAEATQPMGVQITNGEFVSMWFDDPTQVVTTPAFKGVLHFNNCMFWGPSKKLARLDGDGHVNFTQCNFINCEKPPVTEAAMQVNAGSITVNACRFNLGEPKPYFGFGPNAKSAIITGNWFARSLGLDDASTTIAAGQNIEWAKVPADERRRSRRSRD
jgi:hypothetical protein